MIFESVKDCYVVVQRLFKSLEDKVESGGAVIGLLCSMNPFLRVKLVIHIKVTIDLKSKIFVEKLNSHNLDLTIGVTL